MTVVYATLEVDQASKFVDLINRLPQILSGSIPDEHQIASGFKARIGHTLLGLIQENFNELGRGGTGVDGTRWDPLTKEYLAYGRRFGDGEETALKKRAGLNSGHQFAPNGKKGLLSLDQLKLWRKTYAHMLAKLLHKEMAGQAKAHAAAIAWIVVKKAGGKTKLEVFGNRQVQMLVDTGRLRGSITPGTLTENGLGATNIPPSIKGGPDQVFEDTAGKIVVGTNVEYAKHLHKKRRLWPREIPAEWWEEILGVAVSGLLLIQELIQHGEL